MLLQIKIPYLLFMESCYNLAFEEAKASSNILDSETAKLAWDDLVSSYIWNVGILNELKCDRFLFFFRFRKRILLATVEAIWCHWTSIISNSLICYNRVQRKLFSFGASWLTLAIHKKRPWLSIRTTTGALDYQRTQSTTKRPSTSTSSTTLCGKKLKRMRWH